MAKHSPNCRYSTDAEFDDACPICLKPLLTQEEFDHDWGAYAGNPGPWFRRLQYTQRIYFAIFVVFSVVAILFWARLFF